MTEAARYALASIADAAGWDADPERVDFVETPAAIASALPISDVAAGAYGALALAAAEFQGLASGRATAPFVDRRLAGLAMAGNEFLRVNGEAPKTWGDITGYHRTKCGGAVYIHGIFPHLRDGLLDLFGADDDRAAMSAAIAEWTAEEAEAAGQARGLCVMRLRRRAEWEAHPQRAALATRGVLAIEAPAGETRGEAATSRACAPEARNLRPGAPEARNLRPGAPEARNLSKGAPEARNFRPGPPEARNLPLAGVRVLDLTRVIAGPMAGRALAELGADVLRISAAHLPSIEGLVIDTGFAKRNAEIDLRSRAGRETLRALIRDADVLIDGYRPGALAARGFGRSDLAALNPDLALVSISAFSDVGPWAGRRGYDSYVQAGVGLTAASDPRDEPIRLPCQPLDYLSGCLGALGAALGLIRRAQGESGTHAEVSLARTAMWLWEMSDALGPETAPPARNASFEEVEAEGAIRHMASGFGEIAALAPPYGFDGEAPRWRSPPCALGADAPEWA